MTISNKNFTTVDVADIPVDTEYVSCNFARPAPDMTVPATPVGIRLFPGDDTPRTFRDCNLINCEVPPGSTVISCNTAVSEYGVFDYEETVTIDGVVVNTTTFTKQVVYGRWNPDTESYDYYPTPLEAPEGPST